MNEEIECIGVCEPDLDLAYCTGCGRPWGEAGGESPGQAAGTEGMDS